MHDAAGERTYETVNSNQDGSFSTWNRTLTWSYDNRGLMTQEASAPLSGSGSSAPIYNAAKSYEAADNIQQFKSLDSSLSNPDNHYDSPPGFSFTGSGTLVNEPSADLFYATSAANQSVYDAEQRLASFTTSSPLSISNVYDGDGLRAIKTAGSDPETFFLYGALTGEPVVEENYKGSGGALRIAYVNIKSIGERDQVVSGNKITSNVKSVTTYCSPSISIKQRRLLSKSAYAPM